MQNILLNFPGFENNVVFNTKDFNGFNKPWKLLKKELLKIGFEFKNVDQNSLSNTAWVFFMDENSLKEDIKRKHKRNIYNECINSGLKNKMILFLWEGPSICPNNYKKNIYNKFPIIFTWKDDLVDNKKFFKFHLPYPQKEKFLDTVNFTQKKLLVNISINKFSNFPNELYGERRKSIKFFEKELNNQFDLFGYRWNEPQTRKEKLFPFLTKKYKSYRGTINQDKLKTLSKYKFVICYENVQKLNGYITEKIFDCFNAKTIPIYWGAENISDYVDKKTFIDRRLFKTNRELLDFLMKIDEKKYNEYLLAIEKFLNSEKYKLFLPQSFTDTIIKQIKK
ncbi:MAG: hypothetical protein KAS02_00485 [Candidatus Pacebacteria bacterium]|nr:hypothetical protein [Candidatus Paceibacterota bacterium]